MLKGQWRYILIIFVLFTALVMLQHFSPKPIDWRETYDMNHKAPNGCYVLNNLIPQLFGDSVSHNYNSFYNNTLLNSKGRNLLVVTNYFSPDENSIEALFEFVKRGNTVLIAAYDFEKEFLDSFNLSMPAHGLPALQFNKSGDSLNFFNPQLKSDSGYLFTQKLVPANFSITYPFRGKLLGYDTKGRVNYISYPFGDGRFLLHAHPQAFTNINILYGSSDYACHALSYLPVQPTIIDEHYKPFAIQNNSPTRFILSKSPLRTAFYLSLLALGLYFIIGSKRQQRFIPVQEPQVNRSMEFIKTVGRLYYKSENHANIARQKTLYFKEFLRERYFINVVDSNEETLKLMVTKTGVEKSLAKRVLDKVIYFEKQKKVTKPGLMAYHRDIEDFYNTCL